MKFVKSIHYYVALEWLFKICYISIVRCHAAVFTYKQSSLIQSSPGDSDTIHPDDDMWHCWHIDTHHCTAYQSDQLDTLENRELILQ